MDQQTPVRSASPTRAPLTHNPLGDKLNAMKAEFLPYMHVTDRLHTNQGGPWPIVSAGCSAADMEIWAEIFGERVRITGASQAVEQNGAVRMRGDSARSFPEYDDDPRLLMIVHKTMKQIDAFTCEESDVDPSGPVTVPSIDEAMTYLRTNKIPLPEWV